MRASKPLVFLCIICLLSCSAVLAQFGSTVQYFPQFAIDGGAVTYFTIHNPGESALTVDLSLTRSNGSLFLDDQISVEPGATETVSYGEPSGTPTAGWAKLTSDAEFAATLLYRIEEVGNVGVLPSPEAKAMKVFTFVAGVSDTGFAVANPSETEGSMLTFEIYDADGQLQREASFHLDHREHRAFFFSESPYLAEGRGSVTIRATNPVVALALRLDGSLLSSVGVVVPGLPIRGEWTDESPNIIGGYRDNRVREGMVGGTVGGGGNSPDTVLGGANFVTGDYGTVGGGRRNTADEFATVGGGEWNVASGCSSTVAGGYANTASGRGSTVGGGGSRCGSSSFGGNSASGIHSTVSGGWANNATGSSASIVGGDSNRASGHGSTVAGGEDNTASGDHSLAAGLLAEALHDGTFVWADHQYERFQSAAPNQFLIRASGGVGINTNNPQAGLQVDGTGWPDSFLYLNATASTGDSGIRLMQQGSPAWHIYNDAFSGDLFRLESSSFVVLTATQVGNVGINTRTPRGTLDVNGPIYQRGNSLHADYVFEPEYRLESIEDHSRLMWSEKHLPALSPSEKNEQGRDVVEYGSRMRGMLEELEKAHVYIEQLNARNKQQQEEMENLKSRLAEIEALLTDR